jgi:hypothetical protein
MALTLDELKALYKEKGATTRREEETEQGTKYYDDAVQLGDGWTAWENDNRKIIDYIGGGMDAQPVYDDAAKTLGGFTRSEGDKNYFYDTTGKLVHVEKQATDWDYLGPIIMGAITMGGGAGVIGNSLFGLTGTAAAGAGGALAGGFNAAMTDQDILQGALKGGVGSAGALKLSDVLGADVLGSTFKNATLGDVTKAINFTKDPTLAGAANLASPYLNTNFNLGDTGISLNDVVKGVSTAKALGSGNDKQVFDAITGLVRNQGGNLKSSLSGFDANPDDFIEGYFQPGGEGYIDLNRDEMTVREDPEGLDAFLRSLSPYATDDGKSIFTQTEEIPEMETVAKRPKSLIDFLGTPDILEEVPQDEPYISNLRTKEIKSDIPDEITADQIDTLFPDLDVNDILQLITDDTKKDDEVTECAPGFHDDGSGLCVADDDEEKPTDCPDGYILDLATNQCVKVDDTGTIKTVPPTKKITTTPPTTTTKTTEDLMGSLGLGRPAPSQDPYANIKLMEELFGGDVAYKLRALGAPKNLASADMDALVKLLRG